MSMLYSWLEIPLELVKSTVEGNKDFVAEDLAYVVLRSAAHLDMKLDVDIAALGYPFLFEIICPRGACRKFFREPIRSNKDFFLRRITKSGSELYFVGDEKKLTELGLDYCSHDWVLCELGVYSHPKDVFLVSNNSPFDVLKERIYERNNATYGDIERKFGYAIKSLRLLLFSD